MCVREVLSKIIFLAVFHQGFIFRLPSAGRGLSHSSEGSGWVGGEKKDVGGMVKMGVKWEGGS